MTEHDVPDLIHFVDDLGNSVVLRVTKLDPQGLAGEIEVRSSFVSGRVDTWVQPEDLTEWETVLDDLARGDNTAWREGKRATELWIELDDDDRLHVSVVEGQSSLAAVELVIDAAEGWLDDHYERLEIIQKLQAE